jgi:mycofactocin precursor
MTIKPEEKEKESKLEVKETENVSKTPYILEEIQVEELAVDGICGIY